MRDDLTQIGIGDKEVELKIFSEDGGPSKTSDDRLSWKKPVGQSLGIRDDVSGMRSDNEGFQSDVKTKLTLGSLKQAQRLTNSVSNSKKGRKMKRTLTQTDGSVRNAVLNSF